MKSIKYRIILVLVAIASTACVTTLSGVTPTPINVAAITYNVPNFDGVIKERGLIRDISFSSTFRSVPPGARYERLLYENITPSSFVVHRRVDNGIAGSGIKYMVNYTVTESNSGYSIIMQPQYYTTYQQGLIGFPVPKFGENDLRNELTSGALYYKFEINSPYNPESVYTNFLRLVKNEGLRPSEKDLVTGKNFKNKFILPLRNKEVRFVVVTYPYRNGSKVIVLAKIPGTETSPNTIDFGVLVREIEQKLMKIVED